MLVTETVEPRVDAITGAATPLAPTGYYRYAICALLFFATTINYVDRSILGILKSTLMKDLNWTETDYGHVVMAFSAASTLVALESLK